MTDPRVAMFIRDFGYEPDMTDPDVRMQLKIMYFGEMYGQSGTFMKPSPSWLTRLKMWCIEGKPKN